VTALPEDWDAKRQLVVFLSEQRGLEPAETEVRAYMAANPKKDDLLFWLADLYLRHHAADRAVGLLEEVVAKDRLEPPGLNARTSLAKISFARGDRALAEKLVSVVLENAPGNHDALLMRAGMEFDEGRYPATVADLRSVLRDRPRDKDALQMLAEALVVQGHVDLAADTLSQLVDVDPLNVAARVRLAQMYHLNGDSKRALEALALVVKANPTYSVAWESVARIATDTKNWPVAEDAIAKLSVLDGQKLTAVYLRGAVAAQTDKQDEAIRLFTEVVAADPSTPLAEHALTALVASSRATKRLDAASRFIETLHTDSTYVNILLGQCYAEQGNAGAAAQIFDKLIAGKIGRPEPYMARAQLYLQQKNAEQAVDVLEKGQAAVPNNITIPMMLAERLSEAGRHLEAGAVYDDLLARNPGLDAAANNLAELIADYQYSDPIAMEKARRLAERFQGSTNPLLLDTLGWVYYRQGKLTEAVTTLARAVSLGTVPAQVHYHYGAVLLKLNQNDQAKTHLEQATKTVANYVGMDDAKRLLQSM
jgi:predicted Zn-dependent protease